MTKAVAKNFEKKIVKMSFEEAMERLEEIVETLSSQKINLDSMIELYEEGNALKEHCGKRLDEAKMKIETVLDKKGAQS
jgi:exodeoxyribonuclease VII small subunit